MASELRPLIRFVSKKRSTTASTFTPVHFVATQVNSIVDDDVDHVDLEPSIRNFIPTSNSQVKDWIDNHYSITKIDENIPKSLGFFDSIFTSEITHGTDIKIEAIILWIVTFLVLIIAIGWLFKLPKTNSRLILIHILLYEFCYLLYILLSMINVAMNFRLNFFLCDFANYGMYLTIPMMHFGLIFLSIQRLTEHIKMDGIWTKICTNSIITQIVLLSFWMILIGLVFTWLAFKIDLWKFISQSSIHVLPPSFGKEISMFFSLKSDQCSIDGRILPPFKILLFILFVVLIVLLVKSLITSIAFGVFKEMIRSRENRKTHDKTDNSKYVSTISLFAIILCNLVFSYPFYIISIFSFVFEHFESTRDVYTTTIKVSFLLRLISILLQSIFVLLIEKNIIKSIIRCIRARNQKKSIATTTRMESRRQTQRPKSSDESQSKLLETVPDNRQQRNEPPVTQSLINGKLSTESQQIYAAIDDQCPIRATKSLPLPKRTSSSSSSEASSEASPKPVVRETNSSAKVVRNHRRRQLRRSSTRRVNRSTFVKPQNTTSDSDTVV